MLKDWVHLQAVVVLWALLVVIVTLIFHSVPQTPVKMEAPVMMDMVPLPIVHVHQASMDQPAPMTSTTVPQPPALIKVIVIFL